MELINKLLVLQVANQIEHTIEMGPMYMISPQGKAGRVAKDCVIFPGTFNPPTKTHISMMLDAIERSKSKYGYFVISFNHTEGKQRDFVSIAHTVMMLSSYCYKYKNLGVIIVNNGHFFNMVEEFGQKGVVFISGTDLLPAIAKNNTKHMIDTIFNNKWMFYRRGKYEPTLELEGYMMKENVKLIFPKFKTDRSSTQARETIDWLGRVDYTDTLDYEVYQYAKDMELYV